jgi:hypothetical protein
MMRGGSFTRLADWSVARPGQRILYRERRPARKDRNCVPLQPTVPLSLRITRLSACAYVLSFAFFDKAVLFGYDAPAMWLGFLCLALGVVGLRRLTLPSGAGIVGFFLLTTLAGVPFAAVPERVVYGVGRFVIVLAGCVGVYQWMQAERDAIGRLVGYQIAGAVGLSVLAVVQAVAFNRYEFFDLHFPASNLTYAVSGNHGAVLADRVVYRATGTVAEPSWLGYLLLPVVAMLAVRWLRHRGGRAFFLLSVGLAGLACTASLSIFAAAALVTVMLVVSSVQNVRRAAIRLLLALAVCGVIATVLAVEVPEISSYISDRASAVHGEDDVSAAVRYATLAEAWSLFGTHPVLGVGLGNYAHAIATPSDVSVDSGYLLLLSETGLLGSAGFAAVIVVAFARLRRNRTDLAACVRWSLVTHIVLLGTFNFWAHPSLWLAITAALAVGDEKPGRRRDCR